jgi:hypothetical protein
MIKSKFNGYTRDGIRRLFDPATLAAFSAGMSTGTMAGTALTTAGATAGSTAALGSAAAAALPATAAAAAAPTAATELVGLDLANQQAVSQGIMQGSPAAEASQLAQATPGMPPAPPGTPPGAMPPPPAGDTAALTGADVQALQQGAQPLPPAGSQPPGMADVLAKNQGEAFGSPYGLNNISDKEIAAKVAERAGIGGGGNPLVEGFNTAMDFANKHPFYTAAGLYGVQKLGILGGGEEEKEDYGGRVDMSGFSGWSPNPTFRAAEGGPVESMSNMNMYPMSQQPRLAYANPGIQNPMSQNVLSGAGQLDPYTGMPSFNAGGQSKEKKETFFEKVMREDEERMAQARRAMRDHTPDISGPGIVSRTLTQQQRRPDEAARLQLAGLAKQSGVKLSDMPKANVPEDFTYEAAKGGIMHGDLGGYSDGGRLLKGPGDGVSDSIPAVIGKRQPARLADGEFVIPARIVSELGNGSTEAGARQLYAMMERVQKRRKKSIGKDKVAVNSKAHKDLPA